MTIVEISLLYNQRKTIIIAMFLVLWVVPHCMIFYACAKIMRWWNASPLAAKGQNRYWLKSSCRKVNYSVCVPMHTHTCILSHFLSPTTLTLILVIEVYHINHEAYGNAVFSILLWVHFCHSRYHPWHIHFQCFWHVFGSE